MTIGMTSSEFIKRMESASKKPFGDKDITGISVDKFSEIACSSDTISGTVAKMKELGMTEFGLGTSAHILVQANKQAHEAATGMAQIADLLGGLMCKGGAEAGIRAKSRKNLEYVG